jgi:putative restriction endonuclease
VRDDDVRSACFAALDVLQAKWGPDVPYAALAAGFNFRGRRVPFLNRAYGIYRAADAQRGPAALSVNSSPKQIRYQDEQTPDGVLYRYQGNDPENHFNRWLRSAHLLDVPIVYFVGTRPNWYRPIYPTFVERDEPAELRVLLTFGKMRGPYDEREPVHIPDEIERRYVVREVKQRIHQAQFRGAVLPAYEDRCAICRLREVRLLDAAHIVGDSMSSANRSSATASRCARSTTGRSTRILLASLQTFGSTYRTDCSTMKTDRCWTCSRVSTAARSTRRANGCGGPVPSG